MSRKAFQTRSATDTPFEAFVAAVRALGRIGDPDSADALAHAADRPDSRARTESQSPPPGTSCRQWDRVWQLDLTVAESLGKLGVARRDLVEPYLDDPRRLVRHHARFVLENTPVA